MAANLVARLRSRGQQKRRHVIQMGLSSQTESKSTSQSTSDVFVHVKSAHISASFISVIACRLSSNLSAATNREKANLFVDTSDRLGRAHRLRHLYRQTHTFVNTHTVRNAKSTNHQLASTRANQGRAPNLQPKPQHLS